ncbi:MAG: hypothetical protein GY801_32090 [bacterium]|nr:hypothetical protein [bacterium]
MRSTQRELMLFVVGYVFTVQPGTGMAPIEQIVPHATQMPFYQILNAPFRSGLLHVCQVKSEPGEKTATQ